MGGIGNTRYSFNEDYFENIDNPDKAYWLGFLAADGNIHSTRNKVSLNLHTKDRDIIEKFKLALGATHPVIDRIYEHSYEAKTLHRFSELRIFSSKTKLDLMNKGILPRKTFTCPAPSNVPQEFHRDWARGYFDGDGSIYINNTKVYGPRLTLTVAGTKPVLEFIRQVTDCYAKIGKMGKIYRYEFSSKKKLIKFFHKLYDNRELFMERKFLIFKQVEVYN